MPEDYYFDVVCPEIPSFEQSKQFSASFGVHNPWSNLTSADLQQKQNTCKGLDQLGSMNTQK